MPKVPTNPKSKEAMEYLKKRLMETFPAQQISKYVGFLKDSAYTPVFPRPTEPVAPDTSNMGWGDRMAANRAYEKAMMEYLNSQ